MGLSSTLYSGVSGLQANSTAMSVTGNNISNSNTVGFKSSSTIFSDVLSASVSTSSGDGQVGRGTGLSTVRTNFSQGSFQSTSSETDLAIEGEGFFMVSAADSAEVYYTRNGSFSFDADGYLVNAEGCRVQGQAYSASGESLNGDPGDIQVDLDTQAAAHATETIRMSTNLDAVEEACGPFDSGDASATSNYSTSNTVYDALGDTHLVTTYFTKTDDQQWSWHTMVDGSELDGGTEGEQVVLASGTLEFDTSGNLVDGGSGTSLEGVLDWANGADADQQIAFEFDTTQFSSDSVVLSQSQDGYASGDVVEVGIGSDGVVSVSYSNGETQDVAVLSLAVFSNSAGLVKEGNSLYAASSSSGDPRVGTAGSSMGTIFTSALELSTVDLSQEFVDMITIQNGYSASSKVITTVDEMLQELINLKR
jgi:flagellar hook protein FlgE